jgi:palmitoyl transferase
MLLLSCFQPSFRQPKSFAVCCSLACACLVAPAFALTPAADASSPAAAAPAAAVASTKSVADPVTSSSSWWSRAWADLDQTWHSEQYELYVPLHTWHNRRMYTAEKIASYNENPWGIGAGKVRYDDQGNWHALYVMEFLDSHSKVEPIAGYGYEKIWRPSENWRFGLGFTAGLTARQDESYAPIPLVLPLVSVEYGRFSLQSTYVPGGKGNGNVLFTCMRWKL